MMLMLQLGERFALSSAQQRASLALITVAWLALHLWSTLDDDDVAYRDRTSRKLMTRLRRWLRRVFAIRVT